MKVQRLGVEHYDQIIGLLNAVFSRKNNRQMDFEKEMPKMCIRDDEHMSRHFGIFDCGRLVAVMGVYPFDTVVFGQKLKFATAGNIAVHWEYEGKGYMSAMMVEAMKELERLNIDAVRLGGVRSRYNRYGFESCGQNYNFTFTEKNRLNKFPDFKDDITFKKIEKTDTSVLSFATEQYNQNQIIVPRYIDSVYLSLTMWQNIPYVALKNGAPIGYLSVNNGGDYIAEIIALDTVLLGDIICAWQKRTNKNINFSLGAHQIDNVRLFSAVCESSFISCSSHFKIRNWVNVITAFLKLKASYCSLPIGELNIGILDYGTVRIFVTGNETGCELTDNIPDVNLDNLSATRYIFGPYPPVCTAETTPFSCGILPLPLSWNGQDRV